MTMDIQSCDNLMKHRESEMIQRGNDVRLGYRIGYHLSCKVINVYDIQDDKYNQLISNKFLIRFIGTNDRLFPKYDSLL